MFTQPLDPQTQARRALGKVYALLYRLAEQTENNEQKTVNALPLAGETLTAERLTPTKESRP